MSALVQYSHSSVIYRHDWLRLVFVSTFVWRNLFMVSNGKHNFENKRRVFDDNTVSYNEKQTCFYSAMHMFMISVKEN